MNLTEILKKKVKNYQRKSEKTKLEKMAEKQEKLEQQQEPLKKVIIRLVHRFLMVVFRLFFIAVNGRKGKQMPPITDLILMESATSLATKIRTGKLTSVQVMSSFIQRCQEVNSTFNIVVDERYEEALSEAKEADELIKSGKFTEEELAKDKPFLGVPISTKDAIMVKGKSFYIIHVNFHLF